MVFQPKRKYEWSDSFKMAADPNVVGGVLEHLEESDGGVTAERFLDISRPEDSPTHSCFEWNDSVAAERYRMHQSRCTINALRVVYADKNGEDQQISAFVNVSAPEEKTTYENVWAALSDKEKKENVLNRIRNELDSFVIRNQHIEELADMLVEASEKARKRGNM